MSRSTLLGALPIIAKMLGRKLGIEVIIGAKEACTDGRVIYLPALPAEDEALAVLAHGYIDHEAAHIRYTAFDTVSLEGLTGQLTNLLEDIRIERALAADYPGSRHNLARLIEYLAEGRCPVPEPDEPIVTQVMAALFCQLRAQVLGQTPLAGYAAQLQQRLDEQLPQGVVTKLLALAFTVRDTQSTAEVHDLAQQIVSMLEHEAEKPPVLPATPGTEDPSTDLPPETADTPLPAPVAGQGSGAGQGSQVGQSPDDCAQPTPAQALDPDPDSSQMQDDGVAGSVSSPSLAQAHDPLARWNTLRELLASQSAVADLGATIRDQLNQQAMASQQEYSAITMAEYDPPPLNHNPQWVCQQARGATAQLARRLALLIQAHREDERLIGRRGHRLDRRGLHRLAVQDPAVFVRHQRYEDAHTAVGLLLDRSTSMERDIHVASQATLAIALALAPLEGVACWVAAFPGENRHRLVPLKAFDEAVAPIAGRFTLYASGRTPLTEALWRAGFELLLRHEPRRMLIVITDGEPNDVKSAREVIARCRAQGVEIIALGIGMKHTEVAQVFGQADSTAITAIAELPAALFKVMAHRLSHWH